MTINQEIFENTLKKIFNINLDLKTDHVVNKIKKDTIKLGSILRINRGVNEENFNCPEKILFQRLGDHPIATIDDEQFYCLGTLYTGIKLSKEFDSKYILALINS